MMGEHGWTFGLLEKNTWARETNEGVVVMPLLASPPSGEVTSVGTSDKPSALVPTPLSLCRCWEDKLNHLQRSLQPTWYPSVSLPSCLFLAVKTTPPRSPPDFTFF